MTPPATADLPRMNEKPDRMPRQLFTHAWVPVCSEHGPMEKTSTGNLVVWFKCSRCPKTGKAPRVLFRPVT